MERDLVKTEDVSALCEVLKNEKKQAQCCTVTPNRKTNPVNFFHLLPQNILERISDFANLEKFQSIERTAQYFNVVNIAIGIIVESMIDLEATQGFKNIKRICIKKTRIDDQQGVISVLTRCMKSNDCNKRIKEFELFLTDVSYQNYSELFPVLQAGGNLQSLALYNERGMSFEGVTRIWKSNKHLKYLRIGVGNLVSNSGEETATNQISSIANCLKTNCKLKTLMFHGPGIVVDYIGMQVIANALQVNKTLERLFLFDCTLSQVGVRLLSESLKLNNTLSRLDLSYVEVGNDGAKALADLLKVNKSLKELILQYDFTCSCLPIGPEGCTEIANALKDNTILEILDLAGHHTVGDEGAQAFAEALKSNSTLKILKLEGCGVANVGALALAETLRYNSGLIYLNLSSLNLDLNTHDDMDHIAARALDDALKTNSTLEWISLCTKSYNTLSCEQIMYHGLLMDALKSNTTLKYFRIECRWNDDASHKDNHELDDLERYINLLKERNWECESGSMDLDDHYCSLQFSHCRHTLSDMIKDFEEYSH